MAKILIENAGKRAHQRRGADRVARRAIESERDRSAFLATRPTSWRKPASARVSGRNDVRDARAGA